MVERARRRTGQLQRAGELVRNLLCAALVVIGGCGGGDPTSFGLNVTLDGHALSPGDLARVTTAHLSVSGAEQYQKAFDIAVAIKTGDVRFRYIPKAQSGQLTLTLDAVDSAGVVVASGVSDPVDLVANHAIAVRIVLGSTVTDLGIVDAGDDAGSTIGDMARVIKAQGATCTTNAECGSAGGCVDGRCCDTTCTDGCKACNLSGKEGVCTAVPAGSTATPSHSGCGPDAQSSCLRDGKCDGAGACRRWALGTVCQSGTCNSTTNMVTSDSTCDGSGTCKPGTTITCSPYLCKDATVCWPNCSSGTQCSPGNVCNGNSCGKKPLGSMCSNSADCQNGTDGSPHCVDGVCCDVPCAGTCQYCALSATKGMCSLVPANTDPRGVCPAGSNAICAPGGCSGTTMACKTAAQNTPCSAACGSNTPSNTTCDAAGGCSQTATGSACAAYACLVGGGGTTASCATSCNTDSDCNQPQYGCNIGTHQCALANGKSCTAGTQCASGACAPEGICCNTACSGQCEYCDSTGTCQYASGAPHSPRAACINEGTAPCGGSCSGTSSACAYPTVQCANTACTTPCGQLNCYCFGGLISCTNGFCSNGSCQQSCACCSGGYNCRRDLNTNQFGTCWTACSLSSQCNTAAGYSCVNSMCQ